LPSPPCPPSPPYPPSPPPSPVHPPFYKSPRAPPAPPTTLQRITLTLNGDEDDVDTLRDQLDTLRESLLGLLNITGGSVLQLGVTNDGSIVVVAQAPLGYDEATLQAIASQLAGMPLADVSAALGFDITQLAVQVDTVIGGGSLVPESYTVDMQFVLDPDDVADFDEAARAALAARVANLVGVPTSMVTVTVADDGTVTVVVETMSPAASSGVKNILVAATSTTDRAEDALGWKVVAVPTITEVVVPAYYAAASPAAPPGGTLPELNSATASTESAVSVFGEDGNCGDVCIAFLIIGVLCILLSLGVGFYLIKSRQNVKQLEIDKVLESPKSVVAEEASIQQTELTKPITTAVMPVSAPVPAPVPQAEPVLGDVDPEVGAVAAAALAAAEAAAADPIEPEVEPEVVGVTLASVTPSDPPSEVSADDVIVTDVAATPAAAPEANADVAGVAAVASVATVAAAATDEGEEDGEEESEEALIRRVAWIKYYVTQGDLEKARDLGWNGEMSFLELNEDGTPIESPAPATPAAERAEETSVVKQTSEDKLVVRQTSMHRI